MTQSSSKEIVNFKHTSLKNAHQLKSIQFKPKKVFRYFNKNKLFQGKFLSLTLNFLCLKRILKI